MTVKRVLIIGVGGLGQCLVHEALERGLEVAVLVRNPLKLETTLHTADRASHCRYCG